MKQMPITQVRRNDVTTKGQRKPTRKQVTADDIAVEARKLKPQAVTQEKEIGARIKRLRENLQLTQLEVTKALDYSRAAAAQWERGESLPPIVKLNDLAEVLKTTPEFIAFGHHHEPVTVMPEPEEMGFALVPEVTITDSSDAAHEVSKWGLPYSWLRGEMQVDRFTDLCIYKVMVDDPSGKFKYGDRVLIDRGSFRPSPPGNFLYWDGVGAQIAWINVIPAGSGKLMAKVQTTSGTYDVDAAKLKIIGRVKGVWAKA